MGAPQGLCPAQRAHDQAVLGHPSYEVGLQLRLNSHQATLTSPNLQTADPKTNARVFKSHCTRQAMCVYTQCEWKRCIPKNARSMVHSSVCNSVMSTLVFLIQSSNLILAASKRKNTNWRLNEEANRGNKSAARPARHRVTTWKKKRKKGSQKHVREHLWNERKEKQTGKNVNWQEDW